MNKATKSAKASMSFIIGERVKYCLTFEQVRRAEKLGTIVIYASEWSLMK